MLNMTGVRRAVLATFLCAAPLFAASAQASTGMLEREAAREALRHSARAAGGGGVVPLPLPEPPRASASAASSRARTGGALDRSRAPADRRPDARGPRRPGGQGAQPGRRAGAVRDDRRAGGHRPVGRRRRGRAPRRPARGVHRARPHPHDRTGPLRHRRPHERSAADQVHLGLRHGARRRGARHRRRRLGPDRVRDRHRPRREPPGVRRPGPAGVRHLLRRRRRDGHRGPRHLRERPDLGARRERPRRQGRGRHHQGGRGARLARRQLHGLGPDQRHRVLDPPRRGRDQPEPRGPGLHPVAGARLRGRLLQRRPPRRRGGQQRREREPARVPRGGDRRSPGRPRHRAFRGSHEARRHRRLVLRPQRLRERGRARRQQRGLPARGLLHAAGERRHRVGQARQLLARLQRRQRALRVWRGHELRRADRFGARGGRLAGRAPARLGAGGRRDGPLRHRRRLERVHRRRRSGRQGRRGHRGEVRRDRPACPRQGPPPRKPREGHASRAPRTAPTPATSWRAR